MHGMEKPTVFFSHSTLDKEMILVIKNKLDKITGKVLNIFMSSDGQSIPFGKNWEHKIEEGLDDAQIMFVFATPNSITSNWIYFEAGFGYGKKVRVIPVGIGVDVATLKAPLNMLQGFNVISNEGLNNFVTVVNEEFRCEFREEFVDADFREISRLAGAGVGVRHYELEDVLAEAEVGIATKSDTAGDVDVNAALETWLGYLKEKKIRYSYRETVANVRIKSEEWVDGKTFELLAHGISISGRLYPVAESSFIRCTIALNSFAESFRLYGELMMLIPERERVSIRFYAKNDYRIVGGAERISAILLKSPELFCPDDEAIGVFHYRDGLIKFRGSDILKGTASGLLLSYNQRETRAEDLHELLCELIDKKIIYKK